MSNALSSSHSYEFWRSEINSLNVPDLEGESTQGCTSGSSTKSGATAPTVGMWSLACFGLLGLGLGYLIGKYLA